MNIIKNVYFFVLLASMLSVFILMSGCAGTEVASSGASISALDQSIKDSIVVLDADGNELTDVFVDVSQERNEFHRSCPSIYWRK